jgi:WD40 repeat protein
MMQLSKLLRLRKPAYPGVVAAFFGMFAAPQVPQEDGTMAISTETVFDFSSHVAERTRDFTGRTWVFRALDDWLADATQARFFLLTGNPGSGKTAIAARLYQFAQGHVAQPPGLAHLTPGFLSAVHFCSARDGRWIDPRTFSQSMAWQLSKIPTYAQALKDVGDKTISIAAQQNVGTVYDGAVVAAVVINQLVLSGLNAQEAFNRTVLDPLHSIYRGGFTKHITLLVDALDESLSHEGDVTILDLLSRLDDLPAQVRFIITSRHEARVENAFLEASGLFLSAPEYTGFNQDDISGYVDWRLRHGEGLAEPVAQLSPQQQMNVTNTIVRKAEGNFLYVSFLLDALTKGQQTLDNLEGLPAGLDGLYYRSLERVIGLGHKQWSQDYAPLIGVLAVAQESLTPAQLQAFTGQSEGTVWQCLDGLQQFIQEVRPTNVHDTGQEQYRLYHQSVIDFFHRRQLSAMMRTTRNPYYLPAAEWHRRITDAYRLQLTGEWHQSDGYGLRYLPVHFAGGGQLHELRALFCDFRWLQAKLNATDIVALIADYGLLSGEPTPLMVRDALLLSAHVLAQDKAQLPSQMRGRLLASPEPEILRLLGQATVHAVTPWLCPLTASLQAPSGALKRTLVGHRGAINGLALLPDGTRVISAASDKTLKVWNLQSGAVEHTLTGHKGWVSAVAVSPDGRRAISASWDKTLRVWNLETGDMERTLAGHDSAVLAVALINGHLAISASADKTLKVWNLATGMVENTLIGHEDAVSAVALVADGSQAVSASKDRTLRVWNLTTGALESTLCDDNRGIQAVALTPDGTRAISASEDANPKVWNLHTGAAELTWPGHTDSVPALAVMPDGMRALSGSWDRTLKVWDIHTGTLEHTLTALEPVKAVALASSGAWAVSGASSGTLRVWDLATTSDKRGPVDHAGVVVGIAVTADGMRAVSASADTTLKVWNLARFAEERTLAGHSATVRAVVTLPDGRHAVSASWDNTLKLWDMQTGTLERTLTSGAFTINALTVIPPDGRRIISVSEDRVIRVWDVDTGAVERELRTKHSSGIMTVAMTPDGTHAVTGSTDTTLRVYDLLTGAEQRILEGHDDTVVSVVVTHDGRRAISSSRDLTVRVWDLESGAEQGTLTGHTNRVHGLAVTRDDLRAVTASEDNTVKMWDLRDRHIVATFTGDSQMATCAIAPDGISVIAGDVVGKLHFLRLTAVSE